LGRSVLRRGERPRTRHATPTLRAVTALRVRHVADSLKARFDGLIDMTDTEKAWEQQREKVFNTRALAAQALQRIAGIGAARAAASVTDGTGDNGIDGVYVSETDTVVLVQSKWDSNGTGSIGLGETRNFIAGLKDLTDERYDRLTRSSRAM
jgi:hypothetical protein